MARPAAKRHRKNHSFGVSFLHAAHGISTAFKREPNIRRQLFLFVLVLIVAILLRLPASSLLLLVLAAILVLTFELANSALEALADAVHPQYHPHVRTAKDMAAGAVLVASLGAAALGLAVLGPPLFALIAP